MTTNLLINTITPTPTPTPTPSSSFYLRPEFLIIKNSINMINSSSIKSTYLKRRKRIKRLNNKKVNINKIIPNKPTVFLSHAWDKDLLGRDNHKRIKELNNLLLKSNKVYTWFDEKKLNGHIVNSMCNGIDKSNIIIICITRSYIDKCASQTDNNCKLELDYSFERKGTQFIIPIVMEPDCKNTKTWNGSLGAYLNKHLYILFDDSFNNLEQLLNEINRIYFNISKKKDNND